MTTDLDLLPRGSAAYAFARLDLAMRTCGWALRRHVRDTILGRCPR